MTTVADVMTRGVRSMSPQDPVTLAAQAMDELNVGVIPVCEGDKVVGMVTDRDIVVRGVAQKADTRSMKLADVMSTDVRCAHEDDDIDEVLGQMAQTQIRRMPVLDRKDRLVGIVADLDARTAGNRQVGRRGLLDLAHLLPAQHPPQGRCQVDPSHIAQRAGANEPRG